MRTCVIGLAVLTLVPVAADACPVCFGAAESPLLDAARLGVIVMAAVTLSILAAFAAWFLRLRRLAAALAKDEERAQAGGSQ